eukprot:jgi/Astpho2/8070/fgenesh1_pg.00120_%23_49_t
MNGSAVSQAATSHLPNHPCKPGERISEGVQSTPAALLQVRTTLQSSNGSVAGASSAASTPTVPSPSKSTSSISLAEALTPEQSAEGLAQLLQQLAHAAASDSLLREPLVEALQHHADRLQGQAAPASPLWQLAGAPAVQLQMESQVHQPSFGREGDPVCAWLFEWYRTDTAARLLQRYVAWCAPQLAARYLLHPHLVGQAQGQGMPGLEACLVAIHEVEAATRDTFLAADLSQPSVYHQLAAGAAPTLPQDTQPLAREGSTFQRSARTQSITPSGVAALFAASETAPRRLHGVRAWQRSAVAASALHSWCTWMTTFSDACLEQFAQTAFRLAVHGCPWAQAEAATVLREELKCQHPFPQGDSAQPSASTAGAAPQVRVQLSQELLEPLCQGLGHGLYRLRMYSHQSGTLVPAISMPLVGSPKVVGGTAKRDAAQPLRKAIIGAILVLHVRMLQQLSPEGLLLTQALVAQLPAVLPQ